MKRLLLCITFFSVAFVWTGSAALAQRGVGRGGQPAAQGPPKTPGPRAEPRSGGVPKQERAGNRKQAAIRQQTRVVAHMERHPELANRLAPLLPPGMPAQDAAAGFKNTGQFIAALQVSKNLGIPFVDLKTMMTGEDPQPLGRAIQTLRPELEAPEVREAVRTAQREAKREQREAKREQREARRQSQVQPPE